MGQSQMEMVEGGRGRGRGGGWSRWVKCRGNGEGQEGGRGRRGPDGVDESYAAVVEEKANILSRHISVKSHGHHQLLDGSLACPPPPPNHTERKRVRERELQSVHKAQPAGMLAPAPQPKIPFTLHP